MISRWNRHLFSLSTRQENKTSRFKKTALQHATKKPSDWDCCWHQPSDGSWSGVSQPLVRKFYKSTQACTPPKATTLYLGCFPSFMQRVLFAEADKTLISLPRKPMAPGCSPINEVLTYLKNTWSLEPDLFLESKDLLTVPHTSLYFLDWKNDRGEL